jgi:hypothetical protein
MLTTEHGPEPTPSPFGISLCRTGLLLAGQDFLFVRQVSLSDRSNGDDVVTRASLRVPNTSDAKGLPRRGDAIILPIYLQFRISTCRTGLMGTALSLGWRCEYRTRRTRVLSRQRQDAVILLY